MHGKDAAGFHSSVHPKKIGWHQDHWGKIWPVYQTDNGVFVVEHEGDSVTNYPVTEKEIISA